VHSGRLPGRPGIARIVDEAVANHWELVVASTSAEESVRAILEHVVGRDHAARFEVLAGDIVPKKKPAPDIYLLALKRLQIGVADAVVIEDSRNGLLAAVAARLCCVVTLSSYTGDEDMREATLVVSDLGDPGHPMRVFANRGQATPGTYLTLRDLEACLGPSRETSTDLSREGG
jgi:beta-phosphoglucomutase-like phosphatase (HAD superfamily)